MPRRTARDSERACWLLTHSRQQSWRSARFAPEKTGRSTDGITGVPVTIITAIVSPMVWPTPSMMAVRHPNGRPAGYAPDRLPLGGA
jgi:hypothetical protein